jgi:hypothetical protein
MNSYPLDASTPLPHDVGIRTMPFPLPRAEQALKTKRRAPSA